MPYVNDPGNWSQWLEELAIEQAEDKFDQSKCRCPKCDHFGIVSASDDHRGTISECSCLPIRWGIDPETGGKVEFG